MSVVYQPSQWQHSVAVVNGLFYYLDNEDMALFGYPISRFLGKREELNHFIRIEKLFILRPKH